jgi:hypothetical protein
MNLLIHIHNKTHFTNNGKEIQQRRYYVHKKHKFNQHIWTIDEKKHKIPIQQNVVVKFKAIYNIKNTNKKLTHYTLQVLQFWNLHFHTSHWSEEEERKSK